MKASGRRSPPTFSGQTRQIGLIAFDGGEVSTFDIGYTAATILMDLQLLGTAGVIGMDDLVLDWANSFAFRNRELKVGYSHRTGMATRKETVFVPTPASTAQEMAMVETFAELAVSGEIDQRAHYIEAFTQDTRVSGCAVGSGEPVSRHWVAKSDQTPPEWD